MSTELLERRFAVMGARVAVEDGPWLGAPRIDVRHDRFVLAFAGRGEPAEADVIGAAGCRSTSGRTAGCWARRPSPACPRSASGTGSG